jgi:MoaA/NifB/PqqE/SkfB family radical SAM enzyme
MFIERSGRNDMKMLRGTPKHLGTTGEMNGFIYLMLTLPFKCNYRCPKCFNLVNNQPVTSGDPLTLDEIMRTIDAAKALGGRVVVIAGEGEPTLDANIRTIVSRIDDFGMIPIIYSNASSLNSDWATFYRERNACLVIAMDSLKPEVYAQLTGTRKEMLAVVLRNLGALRKTYSDTITEKNGLRVVNLALNMTVCSRNEEEIEDLKALAGEDMYFVCNPLARHGNAIGNWSTLVDGESDWLRQQALAQQYSESGGPLTLNRVGLCGYSVNGIGIGPFGHYMTCAYTARTNDLLGTIRNRSLREAYAFKNSQELQHYARHGVVPCLVRANSFDLFVGELGRGYSERSSFDAPVAFHAQRQ